MSTAAVSGDRPLLPPFDSQYPPEYTSEEDDSTSSSEGSAFHGILFGSEVVATKLSPRKATPQPLIARGKENNNNNEDKGSAPHSPVREMSFCQFPVAPISHGDKEKVRFTEVSIVRDHSARLELRRGGPPDEIQLASSRSHPFFPPIVTQLSHEQDSDDGNDDKPASIPSRWEVRQQDRLLEQVTRHAEFCIEKRNNARNGCLEGLWFHFSQVTNLPPTLVSFAHLRSLRIIGYAVLTVVPSELDQLQQLQELHVSDCPKLESIEVDIQNLPRLQTLGISGCPKSTVLDFLAVTDQEGPVPRRPSSSSNSLQTLGLDANQLTTADLQMIWKSLEYFPNLEHVDLSNNRITQVHLPDLLALYHPPRSPSLDIGGNPLMIARLHPRERPSRETKNVKSNIEN